MDFEPHRVLQVHAHQPGDIGKVPVRPLYAPADGTTASCLSTRCAACPGGARRANVSSACPPTNVGTDLFLSVAEPAGLDTEGGVAELSVRALCSIGTFRNYFLSVNPAPTSGWLTTTPSTLSASLGRRGRGTRGGRSSGGDRKRSSPALSLGG